MRLCVASHHPYRSAWKSIVQNAYQPTINKSDASYTRPIFAAFVCSVPDSAASDESPAKRKYMCISLGSGTRCCGAQLQFDHESHLSAVCIGDGHAEVMARRACVAFFLEAVNEMASSHPPKAPPPPLLQWDSKSGAIQLVPDTRMHLVVSDWPCGFMAAAERKTGGRVLLKTPSGFSKLLMNADGVEQAGETDPKKCCEVCGHTLANHGSVLDVSSEALIEARVKPGKGPPNLHMSCSDKIWRWATEGIMGSRHGSVLPVLRLSSVHIGIQNAEEDEEADLSGTTVRVNAAVREVISRRSALLPSGHHGKQLRVEAFPLSMLLMDENEAPLLPSTGPSDSNFSRSSWPSQQWCDATEEAFSAAKRRRMSASSPLWPFSWATPEGSLTRIVTINSKTGLPAGCTAASIFQRYPDLFSKHVGKEGDGESEQRSTKVVVTAKTATSFPLSRAWMAYQMSQIAQSVSENQRCCEKETSMAERLAVVPSTAGSTQLQVRELLWTCKRRSNIVIIP